MTMRRLPDPDEQHVLWARDAQAAHADRSPARIVPPDEPPPHYLGHRERLRARFCDAGADAIADYELLELLLFRAIPRRDVKPLAKQLIKRFGSFAEVIAAPRNRLREEGWSQRSGHHRTQDRAGRGRAHHARRGAQAAGAVIVVGGDRALPHHHGVREQGAVQIIFLDKRNQIIADEVQQTGTVDHTPVYPREVVKRALELSATAIILVHNHPSGDPTPSRADIQMTQAIIEVAKPLGIAVHDHIIVGKDGHVSLKGLKLI